MDADVPNAHSESAPTPRAGRTPRAAMWLAAAALLAAASASPLSAQDRASCAAAVQGNVAWNDEGTTRWNPSNVERLCRGAENSRAPAACFQQVRHGDLPAPGGGWSWQEALQLCQGTLSARATVACYRDRRREGRGWEATLEACRWERLSGRVAEAQRRRAREAASDDREDGSGREAERAREDGGDDAPIIVSPEITRQGGAEVVAAATSAEQVIAARYRELGGRSGRLGAPDGGVRTNPGDTGKRRRYENGHIYWSPGSGAHAIYFGAIWDKWSEQEWEQGELGYPIQDPKTNPDGTGKRQRFQGGHIYWHPRTGAHVIHDGTIWEQWAEQGWEQGELGYPTSDPRGMGSMITQSFQNGSLTGRADIGGRYLTAASGLCLTLNVFDQPNSRRDRIKRALKKAFDPREHAKAIAAGAGAALVFGPGGGELASTIQHLRTAKKVGDAWKGDLVHGTGVTLLECGSVAPKFQRFERDDRFVRVRAKPGKCVKAKQGQTERNGGRVQMGDCREHRRAAWYIDDGQLRNGRGKCLDVHAPQLDQEGAKVQLWSCNGSRQQRWSFRRP